MLKQKKSFKTETFKNIHEHVHKNRVEEILVQIKDSLKNQMDSIFNRVNFQRVEVVSVQNNLFQAVEKSPGV